MLKQAVTAGLPLIAAQTRDTVNARDVITRILGKTPAVYTSKEPMKGGLYMIVVPPSSTKRVEMGDLGALYQAFNKAEASLIFVNPQGIDGAMFDAGEIETPKAMKAEFLKKAGVKGMLVPALTRALGNATLKETAELLKLTLVRDGRIDMKGLVRSRRDFFQGQSGLTQVLSDDAFYDPPPELAAYIARETKFFLKGTDPRLIPRGLVFDGPPGVGKTAAAKYIADQFGVPLYRFDVGSTQAKYYGQSEGNMVTNLARLDREEPCVALFDEIEKVFRRDGGDEGGVNARMMATLLWWLAEHRSRVFTVMTTNNLKAIPPELHRERRIDKTMFFAGLPKGAAVTAFIVRALQTFGVEAPSEVAHRSAFDAAVTGIQAEVEAASPGQHVPQARVSESVIHAIKDMQVALDENE